MATVIGPDGDVCEEDFGAEPPWGAPSIVDLDVGAGALIRSRLGDADARAAALAGPAMRDWILAAEACLPWYASVRRRAEVVAEIVRWQWRTAGAPLYAASFRASPNLSWMAAFASGRARRTLLRVRPDGTCESTRPLVSIPDIEDAAVDDAGNVAFAYRAVVKGVPYPGVTVLGRWPAGGDRVAFRAASVRRPLDVVAPRPAGALWTAGEPDDGSGAGERVLLARFAADPAASFASEIAIGPEDRLACVRPWSAHPSRDGGFVLLVPRWEPATRRALVADARRGAVVARVRLAAGAGEGARPAAAVVALDRDAWLVVAPVPLLVRADGTVRAASVRGAPGGAAIAWHALRYAGRGRVLDGASRLYRALEGGELVRIADPAEPCDAARAFVASVDGRVLELADGRGPLARRGRVLVRLAGWPGA